MAKVKIKQQTKTPAAIKFEREMRPRLLKANKQLREIVSAKLDSIALHMVAPFKKWDLSDYDISDNADIMKGFSFAKMKSKREMLKEARLINRFLSAPTSTYEGALKYTQEIESEPWKRFIGQFGRKWKNLSPHAYSPEISDSTAALSFKAYRMVEELLGPEVIKQVYGSDKLIAYSYYMIDELGSNVEEAAQSAYEEVINSYERKMERANSINAKMFQLPKIDWQSENNSLGRVKSHSIHRPMRSKNRRRR